MDKFVLNNLLLCSLCSEKVVSKNCIPDGCQCIYHRKCLQDWLNTTDKFECPNKSCNKPFKNVLLKKEINGNTVKTITLTHEEVHECPICCECLKNPCAAPECCNHTFCLSCLEEWSKVRHVCPLDRRSFSMINILECFGGAILRTIAPPSITNAIEDDDIMAGLTCEVCRAETHEDLMLLCDNCDRGYHTFCLPDPLSVIPEGDWYCPNCENNPDDHSNLIDDECLEGTESEGELSNGGENQFTELNDTTQLEAENRALRRYCGSSRLNSAIESITSRLPESGRRRTRNCDQPPQPIVSSDDEPIMKKMKRKRAIIEDDSDEDPEEGIIDTRNISNMSSEEERLSPIKTRKRRKLESSQSLQSSEEEGSQENDSFIVASEEEEEDEESGDSIGSDLSIEKIKSAYNFVSEKPKTRKRRKKRRTTKNAKKATGKKKTKRKPKKKRKSRTTALRKAIMNSSLSASSSKSVTPKRSQRKIIGNSFSLPRTRVRQHKIQTESESDADPADFTKAYEKTLVSCTNTSSSALNAEKNSNGFLSRIVKAQSKMMSKSPIKSSEPSSQEKPSRAAYLNNDSASDIQSLWSESEIHRVRTLVWDLLKKYQKDYHLSVGRIMVLSEKCIQKIMKKPPYCITNSRAKNFINAYIEYDKRVSGLR